MSKKISIGAKPTSSKESANADKWVEARNQGAAQEPMKRLTIDIPESLHRSIKSQCAARGAKITEEVRDMLREKYGQ